jgi:hypothetical protein
MSEAAAGGTGLGGVHLGYGALLDGLHKLVTGGKDGAAADDSGGGCGCGEHWGQRARDAAAVCGLCESRQHGEVHQRHMVDMSQHTEPGR